MLRPKNCTYFIMIWPAIVLCKLNELYDDVLIVSWHKIIQSILNSKKKITIKITI